MSEKNEKYTYLLNWKIRYPAADFESRNPVVIAVFLAIVEHKNCVLKPEYRKEVIDDLDEGGISFVGKIYNFPFEDVKDGCSFWAFNIAKIEHKLLPQSEDGLLSRFKKDNKFVTLITTDDGFTFALGNVGQHLWESANPLNWEMLKSTSKYDPPSSRFDDFADFFEEVNEDYQPLLLSDQE